MNQKIYTILSTLNNAGFEAYIVGGYVRDFLINRKTNDVDIITNALPKDLIKLFTDSKINDEEYGSVKILTNKYNFDINTYRKEYYNGKRRPEKIEYIKSLDDDLLRRDFTMNTICMNIDGKLYDPLKGINDVQNKIIKSVLNPFTKFKEDPLRMLRAIRFATTLQFQLEENIIKSIKKNKKLLKNLSYDLKMKELNLIFSSVNVKSGLDCLKKLDLIKYLDIKFNDIKYVNDLYGIWAQIEFSDKYKFSKQEQFIIKSLKKIIANKKITNNILYEYGPYLSSVAGVILGYDREEIISSYNNLPIKSISELNISSKEIIEILNINPSNIIKEIQKDLISLILCGKIRNEKEEMISYIKKVWRK